MLKFIKHHLDTIDHIGIYPLISFVLFFLFFVAMLWWVWKADKGHFSHMNGLPLSDDTPGRNILKTDHHASN
ncbi:MAG: CcoQ/FixQ family Cbb3-type cytochrome c oxidase assembly chaperone [Flavobacteriales bacterium]|nr:CcoQ/FixQ family Cbb3-type cytochrome c oxidase assembly chaperone [Flavobacteriales bacterium]MCB9167429.1 CcoQ/FixQ family Cbb3-type cytochrome c oxidase assembly chaperone [Flavobacteriales bacterium]MCB9171032.1 CcoQ/FixQ family Cbb3-type cytochrome c oxidase assembly chaperone [Flavobacteriales bacterium]